MAFLEKIEQKKFYIITVIIICIFVGILYSAKFVSSNYISSTSVILIKTNNENKNEGAIELTDNLISNFEEIAKSDLTINEAKNFLGIEISNKEIEKNIDVLRINSSDTIKIIYKNSNSSNAININEKIVKILSEKIKNIYADTEIYIVDSPHIENIDNSKYIASACIGLLIGILIDLIYVIILIKLENNIRVTSDVETELFLKTLVEIPLIEKNKKENNLNKSELICYESEKSKTSKAFKLLRSNIQFLNVNNNNRKVILITSSGKGEGKSYVAANMAVSYAEVGKKVILIDADMISGRQNKIFNLPNNLGLSNYLSNLDTNGMEINELVNKFINETSVKNLNLITSGTVPPNPAELLSSNRIVELMKDLSVFYDVIIIDGTSILSTTDSLILTRIATSTVLVSDLKKDKKEDLLKSKKDIQNVGGKIVGIIINKVKVKKEKKTKEQKKDNFKNFKLNVENKIKEIKDSIKTKLKESKQKLLSDGRNEYSKMDNNVLVDVIENNEKNENNNKIKDSKIDENKKSKIKIDESKVENIEKENINTEKVKVSVKDKIFEMSSKIISNLEKEKIEPEIKQEIQNENIELKDKKEVSKKEKIKKDVQENVVNEVKNYVRNIEKVKETLNFSKESLKEFGTKIKEKTLLSFNTIKEKMNKNKKIRENLKQENKENNIEEDKIENYHINDYINNTDISNKENEEDIEKYINNENNVLVIVDADNAYCRVFSKYYFTEKLIRGIDKVDGFNKAQYSSHLVSVRQDSIRHMYNLTKEQAKRIDTLIYITLCDYDDCVWLEKKLMTNKAESYVLCMTKEFERLPEESDNDYKVRCQRLRKLELAKSELEIEYKLDNIWKTNKMKLTDKIMLLRFAKYYELNKKEKNDIEKLKSKKNKKFYNEIVSSIVDVSTEENLDYKNNEESSKIENIKNRKEANELINAEKIIREEQEKIRLEQEKQKQEQERIKKEKAEERNKIREEKRIERQEKRKTQKEENAKKRLEKQLAKEEEKKQKEIEKEKQKEEAKLEEELLGDNLYPKTKNNKNL